MTVSALLHRVQSEYREMPGLTLTPAQAQRLWGLDENTCTHIFKALVDVGFLAPTAWGYARMSQT